MSSESNLNTSMHYFVNIVFPLVGMVFNSIFLWISTKSSERRSLTDSTMISASITTFIKGLSIFVNGLLSNSFGSQPIYVQLHIAFETIKYFLDGMFIFSILILNINRYHLLSRVKSPMYATKRTSVQLLLLSSIAIGILSICYGIVVEKSDWSDPIRSTILLVLNVVVKEIPFLITILLTLIMISRIRNINGKHTGYTDFLTGISPSQGYPQSSILLRQLLISLLLQICFFIVPCFCLLTLEVLVVHFSQKITIVEITMVTEVACLNFTPCALGILIEPRRGFLMSFICKKTFSSEDKETQSGNLHLEDETDSVFALAKDTTDYVRSARVSTSSFISLKSAGLSSKCPSLLTIPEEKKEESAFSFLLDESEGSFKNNKKERKISRSSSFKSYKRKESQKEMTILYNILDTSVSKSASQLSCIKQGAKGDVVSGNQHRKRSMSTVSTRRSSISTTLLKNDCNIADVLSLI